MSMIQLNTVIMFQLARIYLCRYF